MALKTLNLNDGWRFTLDPAAEMILPDFDDTQWRTVDLPHDWSVELPFSPDAYARNAYLPQGIGGYRLTVSYDCGGLQPVLCFGGIAGQAAIYVNGKLAGTSEWIFAPLELDLTPFWSDHGVNTIAVHVDQSAIPVCRWYAGAGLYRDVTLELRSKNVVFPSPTAAGIFVRTTGKETVAAEYHIRNRTATRRKVWVRQQITAPDGTVVAHEEHSHIIPAGIEVWMDRLFQIPDAKLWSPDTPDLYILRSTLLEEDGAVADESEVRFGIRTLEYSADEGLILNGSRIPLNGVCLHNDLGALGAACTSKGIRRQLEIVKSMGCNAVRTAHNPFGTNFLDLCDELGILVMAEIFDEWREPQRVAPVSDGEFQSQFVDYYSRMFDRRAEQDASQIVLRDRNHPSICLWSIGNEVKEMSKFSGKYIAGNLQQTVHNFDNTRAVTCAVVTRQIDHENVGVMDVAGYNYPTADQIDDYRNFHPRQPMVITECFSAQTRRPLGMDDLPQNTGTYDDTINYVSYFESMKQGFDAWQATAERKYVMGMFIWTGMDYLGEMTPYDYPSRSAYFGVIDICGYPKDGYYFYRSVWKPEEPLVHIALNGWDFTPGETRSVGIITNCPQGELFLNGRKVADWQNGERILFRDVVFEPGELRVTGKTADGRTVEESLFTSGTPCKIELSVFDNAPLKADGHDLAFVTCTVVDGSGRRVRNAALPVQFQVAGSGSLEALDNGSQISVEPFRGTDTRHTCAGRCLAILRAGKEAGTLTLTATAPGVTQAAELTINVQK